MRVGWSCIAHAVMCVCNCFVSLSVQICTPTVLSATTKHINPHQPTQTQTRPQEATINLNALNTLARSGTPGTSAPWSLSFSYGRALQASVLKLWSAGEHNR